MTEALNSRVAQFDQDVAVVHDIVHGPASGAGSMVTTEGGQLKTLAKLLSDSQEAINSGIVLDESLTEAKFPSDSSALSLRPPSFRDGRDEFRRILAHLNARGGKTVTWIGDSITEQGKPGVGSGVGLGVGFTSFIEAAYPNISYANHGIGGNTTLDVIARLSSITATAADLYVVAIGVNDARYNDSRGATTQAAYIANMRTIVDALEATGGLVAVISIWPSFWKDQYAAMGRKKTDDRFKQWNAALQSYCALDFGVPFIDAYSSIVAAIDFSNAADLIPDGVHPDYGAVAGKRLYASAVMRGAFDKSEFRSWFIPTGTIGYKLRVLNNGQADGLASIQMLKLLPYYKEWFAYSADASVALTGLFGSYSAAYTGYKNKIGDFPFEFIVTADQFSPAFLTVSRGIFRGIRAYELFQSSDPAAFSDPGHPSWRLIQSEYSTAALAFNLMPRKREGVFYRLQIDSSTGTDGPGGTTGRFVKVAKLWPGVEPIRFAATNFISTSTGPWERCDLVFSDAGGGAAGHFANEADQFPLQLMIESPQAAPSIIIASVGESGRNIKDWKLFVSRDPASMGDAAHLSWRQIAAGTGDATITPPWPHA